MVGADESTEQWRHPTLPTHTFYRRRDTSESAFLFYNGLMMKKYSPLTKYVNKALAQIRAGDLINHFWSDPLYLEQTLDLGVFTFYDDSMDKLTMDTYFFIFIIWGFGMAMAFLAFAVEIIVFKHYKHHDQSRWKFGHLQRLAAPFHGSDRKSSL